MKESVVQLHSALVDALAQSRHHPPDQPVTVAEIYQDLIPYRMVRSMIGFALNEDYEHALLTLLSGDGGLARVEPSEVQEELRLELHSPNPNVGVFRNYAACDVFVKLPTDFEQRRARRRPPEASPDSRSPEKPTTASPAPSARSNSQTESGALPQPPTPPNSFQPPTPAQPPSLSQPPAPQQPPTTPRSGPTQTVALAGPIQASTNAPMKVTTCISCKKGLPVGRNARFCPFCGHDQTRLLCARCREPMEAGWKFCVVCGSAAS
jgi:hypothetical protein